MPRISNIELSRANKKKYLSPPTLKQIESVLKSLKVSAPQFERFFGLYEGAIKEVRKGKRSLPAHYWHLFFEKVEVIQTVKNYHSETGGNTGGKAVTKSKSVSANSTSNSRLGQLLR